MTNFSQRRQFLTSSLKTLALLPTMALLGCNKPEQANNPFIEQWLASCFDDEKGHHFFGAFALNGQMLSKVPLSVRGHGACKNPSSANSVIVFSRRPDTLLFNINLAEQRVVQQIVSAKNRHFYGHGCFSADGAYLFTSENDFEHGTGVIVVRDSKTFNVLTEFSSGGIGPHQIELLPDGKTLVVANGGILTHPDKLREKLNIETMRSNLAYIDLTSGQVLARYELENKKLSIRHLAVNQQNQVIVGTQYQGKTPEVMPLIYSHYGDESLMPLMAPEYIWQGMNHYTASIAFSNDGLTAVSTSPRGGNVTFWNAKKRQYDHQLNMRDVAGIAVTKNAVALSNGVGQIAYYDVTRHSVLNKIDFPKVKWDNHMIAS